MSLLFYMATSCVVSLCLLACSYFAADAASLHQRNKREALRSGWLYSPQYPQNYPDNADVTNIIPTDPDRICLVTIHYEANIEYANGCVYDRLVLNLGQPDERRVCGDTQGTLTYQTTVTDGHDVKVAFYSDTTVSKKGFKLFYVVEIAESEITSGRDLKVGTPQSGNYAGEQWGNTGTFSSLNYPNNYPDNFDGIYVGHLEGTGPQTVRVHYKHSIEDQINCMFDYLEFASTGQRLCGEDEGYIDIPVSGDTLEFRFHSDNGRSYQGFLLNYEVLAKVVPVFRSRSYSEMDSASEPEPTDIATKSTTSKVTENDDVSTSPSSASINDLSLSSGEQVCDLCEWRGYGNYEYAFNTRMMTFDDAMATCTRCGGQLIMATDQEDFDLTQSIMADFGARDIPHWLAATDRDVEGQWSWLDGSPLSFTLWHNREPDNVDEGEPNADCLMVSSRGQWRDEVCSNTRKSLCQRELGLTVPCIPAPETTAESVASVTDTADPEVDSTPITPSNSVTAADTQPPTLVTDVASTYFISAGDKCCSMANWRLYGQHEYCLNNHMLTFDQALAECIGCGGQLITARNNDEFDLTQRICEDIGASDVPHWLAATDRQVEGQWTWLDGSPLTFTFWKRREPDNAEAGSTNADCLIVNNGGDWKDEDCNSTRKSLCIRPQGTITTKPMCLDPEPPEVSSTPTVVEEEPAIATLPSASDEPSTNLPAPPVDESEETGVYIPYGERCCSMVDWRLYGQYEYSFNNHVLTFDQAVAKCIGCGGQLITAWNNDEFLLTQSIFKDFGARGTPHWLAATDRELEGQWTWLDGSPFNFTLWKGREPDNVDESLTNADCLVVTSAGDWKDEECSRTRKSLCKRPQGTFTINPECSDAEQVETNPLPSTTLSQYPTYSSQSPDTAYPADSREYPANSSFVSPTEISRPSNSSEFSTSSSFVSPTEISSPSNSSEYSTSSSFTSTTEYPKNSRPFNFTEHPETSNPFYFSEAPADIDMNYLKSETATNAPPTFSSSDRTAPPNVTSESATQVSPTFSSSDSTASPNVTSETATQAPPTFSSSDITASPNFTSKTVTQAPATFSSSDSTASPNFTSKTVTQAPATFSSSDSTASPNVTSETATQALPTFFSWYSTAYTGSITFDDRLTGNSTSTPSETQTTTSGICDQPLRFGNSGYLTSPNYPGEYPNNVNCEMTVVLEQPGPQTVRLFFHDLDIEQHFGCAYDYILINGDLSNKLCGVLSGQQQLVDVPGNNFSLTFHTDSSQQRKGFNISYAALPKTQTTTSSICDQPLRFGNSGYLTSPNYPGEYPNNVNCEMTVVLEQPGPQTVRLFFHDLDIEQHFGCAYDYILINGDLSNKLCGVLSGQQQLVDVPGNNFSLTFHTDSSQQRKGFNISYAALPKTQTTTSSICDQPLRFGNSGYLTSPNYPGEYPNNVNCEMTVVLEQPGPQTVRLFLGDLDIEQHFGCPYDYILINGDLSNKLCGVLSGQQQLVDVPGDSFNVTFHSDGSDQHKGFNISYTALPETQTTSSYNFSTTSMPNVTTNSSACLQRFQFGNSGYLTSPNYPGEYPSNVNCEMTVVLEQPGPQTVILFFNDLDIEQHFGCPYDYILVNGDYSNKLCGNLSGQNQTVEIPGDNLTLTFHSDNSVQFRGFNISYTGLEGVIEPERTLMSRLLEETKELNEQMHETLEKLKHCDLTCEDCNADTLMVSVEIPADEADLTN